MQRTTRRVMATLILLAATHTSFAQKTNPVTGINWPLATGSGAPTLTCNSSFYGLHYTDIAATPNKDYLCGAQGWIANGGGGGSFTTLTPGTNTSGALVVGSGSSLGHTGTGTVDATAINGVTVVGTPTTRQVPVGTGNTATWGPLTQDDILPGFSITGFGCSICGTFEIGTARANPSFSSSYSSTPSSANVTDGQGSTVNLTISGSSASGSITHTYNSAVTGSVGFTLTATSAVTRTAGQGITWLPRQFGGVGSSGATGATSSGSNAPLTGASGTLTDAGLSSNPVGSTFGPYSPSGQKIYLLVQGCSHTFTSSGFAFPMLPATSITFVNQNGSSVTSCLYESQNLLSATFSVLVTN